MRKLIGVIQPTGQMVGLYNDNSPLRRMDDVEVTRASNVEPDGRGGWIVQFSDDPQNKRWRGQYLSQRLCGFSPERRRAFSFQTRQAALDAEVKFLTQMLEVCR